jgi:chromosome segregation ATPase
MINNLITSNIDDNEEERCLLLLAEAEYRIQRLQEDFQKIREDQSKIREDQSNIREDLLKIREDQSKIREDQSKIREDQSKIREDLLLELKYSEEDLSFFKNLNCLINADVLQEAASAQNIPPYAIGNPNSAKVCYLTFQKAY